MVSKMATRKLQPQLKVAMFPWFAIGHITPYIHLSNRLAARGHRVHFLLPGPTTLAKLAPLNRHPHLITFHPIAVPHVDGLPRGAETTADVPPHLTPLLFAALDATEDQFRSIVARVGPLDVVLYDSAMWVPRIGREVGFLTMTYGVVSASVTALRLVPSARLAKGLTDEEMARTPPGYPPQSAVVPRPDEIKQTRIFHGLLTIFVLFTSGELVLLFCRVGFSWWIGDGVLRRKEGGSSEKNGA